MTQRLFQLSKHFISNNQPIQQYRKSSKLDIQEFKEVSFGPFYAFRDKTFDVIVNNPNVFKHVHLGEYTRQQHRQLVLKQLLFWSKNQILPFNQFEANPGAFSMIGHALFVASPSFNIILTAHFYLYFKAIYTLGTKIHSKYLERAIQYKDIGCFGLTEFGHGSNVRNILTEAHYDHSSKSFIISSPTKQAMKFWIGAAANLANMAVIWAQLYIQNKCYGVHAYIVPVRDPKTHDLLPGVLIGDCGPKAGMGGIDNGFIILDKVKIPLENQLNRLSGVDTNGKFITTVQNQDKRFGVQLNPLSGGRVLLPVSTTQLSICSLAIAIRYVLQRKQFSAPKSNQQILLFNYPLTKYRLIPLLAQTMVYQCGSVELNLRWDDNLKNLLDPNNKDLPEFHAVSSTTKPKTSWFTSKVIAECRQMLGGHGYHSFSRLGQMYNDNDVNLTWEGDNNVLLQQTAKYILSNAQKSLQQGYKTEDLNLDFLTKPTEEVGDLTIEKLICFDVLENILKKRIKTQTDKTIQKLLELKSKGMDDFDIWNSCQINYLQPLALFYGDIYFFKSSRRTIPKFKNAANRAVFEDCVRLWVWKIFQQQSYGDDQTKKIINQLIRESCQSIGKQAVSILDAIAPPVQVIGSPFADPHGLGMKKYVNMLYSGKDTFKKVDWYEKIIDRQK